MAVWTAGTERGSGAPPVPLLERPSNWAYRVGEVISLFPPLVPVLRRPLTVPATIALPPAPTATC